MMKRIMILGLAMLVLLSGCRQATTVILPPETGGTEPPTAPPVTTTAPPTDPTDAGTDPTEPSTEPTEPPTTVPATEPPPVPPTEVPTAPPTQPPTTPPTQPPTQPPTVPPTQPPTEPPTEAPTEPDVYDISAHSIGDLEWSILAELNARRAAAGLPELPMDTTLCALAAIRAYECTLDLSHSRPDGRDWSSVLADYGCAGISVGETVLYGSTSRTAAEMVNTWERSTASRGIVLHEDARKLGIGIWYHDGLIYVVGLFIG